MILIINFFLLKQPVDQEEITNHSVFISKNTLRDDWQQKHNVPKLMGHRESGAKVGTVTAINASVNK